jgi:hypothetical protein
MSLVLLSAFAIIFTACVAERAPAGSNPLTIHYVKLLRAQLTAKDPYQANVLLYCEGSRIIILLTNEADDPLEGQNRAVELLHDAARRAFTPADAAARNRVDSALDGQVFDALANCDSLARAGELGDTSMPKLRPRRF